MISISKTKAILKKKSKDTREDMLRSLESAICSYCMNHKFEHDEYIELRQKIIDLRPFTTEEEINLAYQARKDRRFFKNEINVG